MAESEIEVWGTGTPRTMRVYWALEELGLSYRRRPIRTRTEDMDSAAFLAVSPGKKIPVVVHRDLVIRESGAITDYLFRLARACPTNLADTAAVEQWCCFTLMELDATALYVLRRHRGLPGIYGVAEKAVDAAVAYFERQAAVVAAQLDDGREFIVGSQISKADIVLVTTCRWAGFENIALPDVLDNYCARLMKRPAYQRARRHNAYSADDVAV